MKRTLLLLWLVALTCVSIRGNEVKVVRSFEMIGGMSVSLARSEWKKYHNPDAKVPMEYSIFKVRIKGNADAVKRAKSSFKLDLGSQLVVRDTYTGEDNEIWFLVPAKAKLVYLKCGDGCKECLIWDRQIIPDKVYYGEVEYTVEKEGKPKSTSQYFVLTFEPKDAMVEVDGVTVYASDGVYSGMLSHGRHEFRVSMDMYHSETGTVEIGFAKVTKEIRLRPAFGWIEIKGPNGASVYIDNRNVGSAPMKSEPVASGSHDVRIVREKYLPYREQVQVNDNKVTTVNPVLTANFVTVNLVTGGDAEIWVNGEQKGSGSVSMDLTPGEYTFETRKASHRSQSVVRNITMSSGDTIDLPAPVAITGTLMVNVKPVGADIMVDGHKVGESPMLIENMLIGTHEVVISKAGCAERREQVTVTEGQTITLDGSLAEGQNVRLSCGVANAHWTIDGVDWGTGAEITVSLSYAGHDVVIKAAEYKDFSERFTVFVGTTYMSFAMKKVAPDFETITVNGVTFRIRRVEGGTFQMGSASGDSDEKPVHSVTLSSYYIGETEVTLALWKAVMGSNPSKWRGDNLPVEQVSWDDCQEFIEKLNQLTGHTFALPTEAQWEYAARGGNKSRGYEYSGSNNLDDVGWYSDNSSNETHPVGKKQANELGLYDMSGNVWEWCKDWYGSYTSSSQTDPAGPSSGSNRVIRGGSWSNRAGSCRSAFRGYDSPGDSYSNFGFRLALPSEDFTVSSETKSKSGEMQKTPCYGSVEVDVKPYKSSVVMDGKYVGETPLSLDYVLVGSHRVTVKAEKYNDKTETLTVYDGRTSTMNGKLTRYVRPLYKREKYYDGLGFQGMLDLNSNFTLSHWGIGADLILGKRSAEFYHIGCGLGLHSMLNVNMSDYNVFTSLYINNIFFIPTHREAFPMFDFAIGGYFGWIGINQPYKFTSCGLYGKAGFGIETNYFNISTGYEFMGTHTVYVKIGFNFW